MNKSLSNKPHSFGNTLSCLFVYSLVQRKTSQPPLKKVVYVCLPVTGAIYRGSTAGDKVLKLYKEHQIAT